MVEKLLPGAQVYLIGGAAEDKLTVFSDIDLLVVLPYEPKAGERVELLARLWEALEEAGVPPETPLDLHITGPEGFARYARRARRMVRLA